MRRNQNPSRTNRLGQNGAATKILKFWIHGNSPFFLVISALQSLLTGSRPDRVSQSVCEAYPEQLDKPAIVDMLEYDSCLFRPPWILVILPQSRFSAGQKVLGQLR
jgi:hypothetical protein